MSMRPADRSEHQTTIGVATQDVWHVRTTLSKPLPERAPSKNTNGRPSPATVVSTKVVPNLQLPSFDLLGIAAPHPDRTEHHLDQVDAKDNLALASASSPYFSNIDMSPRCDPANHNALGLLDGFTIHAAHRGSLPSVYALTLTPPADETAPLSWDSSISSHLDRLLPTTTANKKDPSSQRSEAPTNAAALSDAGESSIALIHAGAAESLDTTVNATNPSSQPSNDTGGDIERTSWLDESIRILVSTVATSSSAGYAVRVLSHTLPCPSSCESDAIKSSGSLSRSSHQPSSPTPLSPSSAFPNIIDALHDQLRPGQAPCIHVTHAVPSRFNLANLPSSPPGTPNLTSGGEDYFTTMVFSSAVPLLDHQGRASRQLNTPVPSSPCPIVPPSSIHISLMERYIPPKSAQEYLDLFSINSSSILVDRLVELSPEHGRLLFIYPTKNGGRTFGTDFLGPLLDPILRAMVVVNEFSADLGNMLGRMEAVDQMLGFYQMKRSILSLCTDLSRSSKYSLVYSDTAEVLLDRKVWSDWWVQQESGRIREVLGRYFRKARRLPVDSDVAPINLIREIIDGVSTRHYEASSNPDKGVEVGVFIIQRAS